MNFKMPKLANQIFLGTLIAAFSLTACNSKKKEDKKEETPTIQAPDTTKQKMDTPNLPEDTLKKKPTAQGDLN